MIRYHDKVKDIYNNFRWIEILHCILSYYLIIYLLINKHPREPVWIVIFSFTCGKCNDE